MEEYLPGIASNWMPLSALQVSREVDRQMMGGWIDR